MFAMNACQLPKNARLMQCLIMLMIWHTVFECLFMNAWWCMNVYAWMHEDAWSGVPSQHRDIRCSFLGERDPSWVLYTNILHLCGRGHLPNQLRTLGQSVACYQGEHLTVCCWFSLIFLISKYFLLDFQKCFFLFTFFFNVLTFVYQENKSMKCARR